MTAVQMMCARLGMVTGRGVTSVIRHEYSRWMLWGADAGHGECDDGREFGDVCHLVKALE
jgi:hypothetical protein